ncbi:MAG: hypothetical protein RL120_12815, partial [Gammaproteobacteria bacterium]
MKRITATKNIPTANSKWISVALVLLLGSCATRPASTPDMAILEEIQGTLDQAAIDIMAQPDSLSADEDDLLDELIPGLSLDESLLTPVEERVSISSPNLPADV